MRGIYKNLHDFPYLYSSNQLRGYYEGTRNDGEVLAIKEYMEQHGVFDNSQYKGYLSITRKIQEDLYVPEAIDWMELQNEFTPIVDFDGSIRFKKLDKIPKWLEGF